MQPQPVTRYPLLWLSGALLLGMFAAPAVGLDWALYLTAGVALGIAAFTARRFRRPRLAWAAVLLLAACLGAARWQAAHPALTQADVAWWAVHSSAEAGERTRLTLTGRVAAMPEPDGDRLRFMLRADSLRVDGSDAAQPVRGEVIASVPRGSDLRYGDQVRISGTLTPIDRGAPGVRVYLSSAQPAKITARGKGNLFQAALFAVRRRAYETVKAIFPPREAALVNGILLGLDGDIPEELAEAYRVTGTAHIIAISGFNIAVLAQACAALFAGRMRRWRALLATLLVVGMYTLLAGGDPPVARAAVMGALVLAGQALGRRSSGLTSLAFTAALLCLFSPDLPWDISFQLSFAATLGLVLYAGPLQSAFHGLLQRRVPARWAGRLIAPLSRGVGEYLLVTLAAQITTLPLMVLHFERVAAWGLLTNLLVLPPQPLVMMLSGAAAIVGMIWLPAGKVLGWLAWPLPAYSNAAVELLARLPGGNLDVSAVAPGLLALVYALLFVFTWAWRSGRATLARLWKPAAALVAGGLAVTSAWSAALSAPDGRLHLALLPAADGALVLVTAPDGRSVLIASGSLDADALVEQATRRLPVSAPELDGIVLADADASSLPRLIGLWERMPVGWLAATDGLWATPGGEKLEKAVYAAQIDTGSLPRGARFDLGDGARLEVLAETENAAALRVEWGQFCAVLPGSAAPGDVPDMAGCTLLILGKDAVEDWSAVQPQIIWRAGDAPVQIETDGRQMWVHSGE